MRVSVTRDKLNFNQFRVEAKQTEGEVKGNRVWSFTVYDTTLEEMRKLLTGVFEQLTGDKLPQHHKRK